MAVGRVLKALERASDGKAEMYKRSKVRMHVAISNPRSRK
jgi:hypothetical protein